MSSPAPQIEPEWEFAEHTQRIWQPYRYKILHGGRGGVKSWTAARYMLIDGYQRPLRQLCGREVQRSIKESVHQLLADQIQILGLGGFYEVLQTEIKGKNGSRFAFTGLSNLTAETIKSYEGYDRFWGEEAQSFTRRSLDILYPTMRTGHNLEESELLFTLNPLLDTDEIFSRFIAEVPEDALVIECSYHNNPWFPKVLEKERLSFLRAVKTGARAQMDYDNIWEGKCRPAAEGAIYPDEVQATMKGNRLCQVEYDPTLYVHLIFDIGWNDKMAIGVVQVAAGSIRLIDYIEDSHRTYESYLFGIDAHGNKTHVGLIDGVNGGKRYAKRIKTLWLPHDAKAANPQTGKSSIEIVKDLVKLENIRVPKDGIPDIGVKPGIEAARQMFHRVYFDKVNCTPLFNRLRRYARVISPMTDEPGKPKHDENSHGADMFRYIAVIEKELTNESETMDKIDYDDRGIV